MYTRILDSFSRFREKLSLRWTGQRRSGHTRDHPGEDSWSCGRTVCLYLRIGLGVYLSKNRHCCLGFCALQKRATLNVHHMPRRHRRNRDRVRPCPVVLFPFHVAGRPWVQKGRLRRRGLERLLYGT